MAVFSLRTRIAGEVGMPKTHKIFWSMLVIVWLGLQAFTVMSEAKLPSTDVFLFKEAGINFALHGKLAAKNLPNMPADQELVFSYYPPAYPFCFGVWTKFVGIGLKQSLAFDTLLRILRTLLMGLFFLPWFRGTPKSRWLLVGSLFLVSFLSSDGDRPDELAMVWGWAAWLSIREARRWIAFGLGGILLGLCAATSPAAGVFFVMGALAVGFYSGVWELFEAFLSAVVAGFTFILCNLPIYLSDRLAYSRFSKQVPLSTFPYLVAWKEHRGFAGVAQSFFTEMKHPFIVAGPLLFFVGFLTITMAVVLVRLGKRMAPPLRALLVSSFLYVVLCVLVWTLQPNYLWFCGLCFLGLFLSAMGSHERFGQAISALVVMIALGPLLLREVKSYSGALERQNGDLSETIRSEVMPIVGMDSKFAVTHDQYFTFRGDREVENIQYVCRRLNEYDFVYVTRYNSASLSDPKPYHIPCDGNTGCFTVKLDLSQAHRYHLLGYAAPYVVKGSSGILYENTACPHPTRALSMNP